MASGIAGQDPVAVSRRQRLADAAGHDPCRMDALAAEPLDDLLAELAQADAVARQRRVGFAPRRRCCAGPDRRPSPAAGRATRDGRSSSACDWTIWARFMMRRSFAAVAGMRTARMASQALAEAIRWLTGQMPQMRAMSDGIS